MRVLLGEDDETTLVLLQGLLEEWGHEVVLARDGAEVWAALEGPLAPKLALLDWQMPRGSGLEICNRLKAGGLPWLVYVVLMTVRQGQADLLAALEGGAHDFLRKPVDAAELRSRLLVGERILTYESRLEQSRSDLARYAASLEELAEARARQLVHADRLATLGTMAASIAHEINNPTAFVAANLQTLERFWACLEPRLAQIRGLAGKDAERIDFIQTEMPGLLQEMQHGVNRVAGIVAGLRRYSYLDRGVRTSCSLNRCVSDALQICGGALKRLDVVLDLSEELPTVQALPQQIEQVLINLVLNAADAVKEHGRLLVRTRAEESLVRLEVEDSGPGIPEELSNDIWKPFFTTKPVGKGTGLGLSVSQGIVESHGGKIWVEPASLGGARFVVALPTENSVVLGSA